MSKELGFKIRRMREIMGVKQEVVADGLGIKQSTYSDIEAGKIELKASDERFKKLAELIGTTTETIEAYEEGATVIIVNHNGGVGTAAYNNQFTIQMIDDWQKLGDLIAMPFKEQITLLKEQVAELKAERDFLRNLVEKGK
ncbi:MAG: helix-turn-helix transcriptional regulator [Saprospiraceae bacterium]|nr:helix-turn-helix transcriptional regulator [Saprospiraceae bacterium]